MVMQFPPEVLIMHVIYSSDLTDDWEDLVVRVHLVSRNGICPEMPESDEKPLVGLIHRLLS